MRRNGRSTILTETLTNGVMVGMNSAVFLAGIHVEEVLWSRVSSHVFVFLNFDFWVNFSSRKDMLMFFRTSCCHFCMLTLEQQERISLFHNGAREGTQCIKKGLPPRVSLDYYALPPNNHNKNQIEKLGATRLRPHTVVPDNISL